MTRRGTGMENDVALTLLHTADWHLGRRFPAFGPDQELCPTRARLEFVGRILDLAHSLASRRRPLRGRPLRPAGAGRAVVGRRPPGVPAPRLAARGRAASRQPRPAPAGVRLLPGAPVPIRAARLRACRGPAGMATAARRGAVVYASPCTSHAGQTQLAGTLPARAPDDRRIRIGLVHGQTFDSDGHQTNSRSPGTVPRRAASTTWPSGAPRLPRGRAGPRRERAGARRPGAPSPVPAGSAVGLTATMWIQRLEVADWAGIASAAIDLEPGLNVLHGPNELGKSSLVNAIRAAAAAVDVGRDRALARLARRRADARDAHLRTGSAARLAGAQELRQQRLRVPRALPRRQRVHAGGQGARGGRHAAAHPALGPQGSRAARRQARHGRVVHHHGCSASRATSSPSCAPASPATATIPAANASARRCRPWPRTRAFKRVLAAVQEKVDEAFTTTSGRKRTGQDSPWAQVRGQRVAAEAHERDVRQQPEESESARLRTAGLHEQLLAAESAKQGADGVLAALDSALARHKARDEAGAALAGAEAECRRVQGLFDRRDKNVAALAAAGERVSALEKTRAEAEAAAESVNWSEASRNTNGRSRLRKRWPSGTREIAALSADIDKREAALEARGGLLRDAVASAARDRDEIGALEVERRCARYLGALSAPRASTAALDAAREHARQAAALERPNRCDAGRGRRPPRAGGRRDRPAPDPGDRLAHRAGEARRRPRRGGRSGAGRHGRGPHRRPVAAGPDRCRRTRRARGGAGAAARPRRYRRR